MADRPHIASLLRNAREQHGLSMEVAATQSGVPLRYALLLEGESPTVGIPDECYLIPFFRKYAGFVGLEVERLLPEFIGQVQRVPGDSPPPAPIALDSSFAARSAAHLWKPTAAVLAVAAAAVLLLTRSAPEPTAVAANPQVAGSVGNYRGDSRIAATPAGVTVSSSSSAAAADETHRPGAAPGAGADAIHVSSTRPASTDELETAAPDGARELRIVATEQVWLEIGLDDQPRQEFLLEPGESHTWRAHDEFMLKVGNAGGVSLAFDGEELPPLGESGQVVRVRLPYPAEQASGG